MNSGDFNIIDYTILSYFSCHDNITNLTFKISSKTERQSPHFNIRAVFSN